MEEETQWLKAAGVAFAPSTAKADRLPTSTQA